MRGKQFGKGRSKVFPVRSLLLFGARTNWRVRRSCLFRTAVCQTNRQFYFAGESGKKLRFLMANGMKIK